MAVISSQGMYLKTIYRICARQENVRNVDIAKEMSFSKSSVSVALQKLVNDEYVIITNSGIVALTDKGREEALKAIERYDAVYRFLVEVGADENYAKNDAEIINSQVSDELIEVFKKYKNN